MRVLLLLLLFLLPGLAAAQTERGEALHNDLFGEIIYHTVHYDDTFVDLAQRYDVGFIELRAANPGVDPWVPAPGTQLIIPKAHIIPNAPRRGIIINLAELRLYRFIGTQGSLVTYPIGIGRDGARTPLGTTKITSRRANPTWYPPASIRAEKPGLPSVVPPGPDNPLGEHALYLGWRSYLIHGTNLPAGVGRRSSHGCIRMYPEDVASLFRSVANGTAVTVVDQPVKLGWSDGDLYLQIHPTQSQADEIEASGAFTPADIPDLVSRVHKAAGAFTDRIDWDAVEYAAEMRLGVPLRITQ